MRALLQVVTEATVEVDQRIVGSCGRGLCIFLGVVPEDGEDTAAKLWRKISRLRIFPDDAGRTNRSIHDIEGSALIVSQFTLCADVSHGCRPSFTGAAAPDQADALYKEFCRLAREDLGEDRVGEGVFGADMKVSLVNDGPFTIWLDTDTL